MWPVQVPGNRTPLTFTGDQSLSLQRRPVAAAVGHPGHWPTLLSGSHILSAGGRLLNVQLSSQGGKRPTSAVRPEEECWVVRHSQSVVPSIPRR